MSQPFSSDANEAQRRAAIRCVDDLLGKLDAALQQPLEPGVLDGLAGYDGDALLELAGHLRDLGIKSTANRLVNYHARYLKHGLDRGISNCIVSVGESELWASDFPSAMPLPDPEKQDEIQETRGLLAEGALQGLASLLRSVRVELVELGVTADEKPLDRAILRLSQAREGRGLKVHENADWLTADVLTVLDHQRMIMWLQHDGRWTNAFVDNWPRLLAENPSVTIRLSAKGQSRAAELRLARQAGPLVSEPNSSLATDNESSELSLRKDHDRIAHMLAEATDPARFPIRILQLLTSLRMDRINREVVWQEAIKALAKQIVERDTEQLTNEGKRLIVLVEEGKLREAGQRNGRRELIGDNGLKEIDEGAYQFYQHRGNPDASAAEIRAENELKDENATAWMNWHRTPWRFAIEKLWTDRGCLRAPQGGPFVSFDQFEESLNEATYAFRTTDVEAVILGFLREQDEAGYADKLIASTRSAFPDDACLEPPVPRTFEFEVPPLPTDPHSSEEWMPQAAAAGSMGYKNHKHLKNARKAGERAANGSVGRDPQGRMWRRDPSDSRLFWYFKPSLIEKNPSRKRRNDRLQRSCDIVTSENSPT